MANEILGKTGTDTVSGFTGTITARTEYLYGDTPRVQLVGKAVTAGGLIPEAWIEETRLKVEG